VDEPARRRAPDERIVDDHDTLSGEDLADGAVLQPDLEVAPRLGRLDEGAPDVVVADEPQLEGNPRLLGEAERGGVRRVRDGDDAVGIRGLFDRELTAEGPARPVDGVAPEVRVRPREIHQLENAGRGGGEG